MTPRYKVVLTNDERQYLEALTKTGKRAARTVLLARALLLVDQGEFGSKWLIRQVADAVGVSGRTIEHLKKRFVEDGLEKAIERKKLDKPPRKIQFGGEFEAHLLALACSEPPEGRSRWTIRLLTEKLVELKIVTSVSTMTVCNTLKKMKLSLT